MTTQQKNYLALMAKAVGVKQLVPLQNPDRAELFKIASFHDMQNLLAEAINGEDSLSETVKEKLKSVRMTELIKDVNQEAEVNALIEIFERNNIDAIMLKGWYMKQLYPRRDLRSMADTDIFIHRGDEEKVHDIITASDYSTVTYGGKKDNVYQKLPFVTLEMHKNLFEYEDEWNACFNLPDSPMYVWNRTAKIDGYSHIYRMDDEQYFVYMLAHTAKHLKDDGGIGVRAFLDIWVYLNKKPNLDFEIIAGDLDSLNLRRFADTAVKLAKYWFGGEPADSYIEDFSDYILQCGVYGNSSFFVINNEIMRDGKKRGKWSYAFRRAFPTFESMKLRYPQLERKPFLLPVCYAKRLSYSLIHRKSAIRGELSSAENIDFAQAEKIHTLYKNIGLQ